MAEPQKIFIVEDEPLISMMLEDFLEILGRQSVGNADTVESALEQLETSGADAVILDVHLRGGEKSWPVAEALAERNIPFVLATGGSGEMIDPAFRDRPVLAKPFTIDGVQSALSRLA